MTGGGRGIGRAIAHRLARTGVAIGIVDLDGTTARAVANEIAIAGGRAVAADADVGDLVAVQAAVRAVEDGLGPLDVLVNNAGIFPRAAFLDLAEDEWDAVLATNLKGTFVCAQEAARRMVAAGRPGVIVNLSSGAPYRGGTRSTAYMASKLGIVGLTRGMARELAPHRIRVNAIAPGVTNTAMPRLGNTEEALAAMARNSPTGRLAEVEDIADVIVFLATDDARHVIGQLIHVNGGEYHG